EKKLKWVKLDIQRNVALIPFFGAGIIMLLMAWLFYINRLKVKKHGIIFSLVIFPLLTMPLIIVIILLTNYGVFEHHTSLSVILYIIWLYIFAIIAILYQKRVLSNYYTKIE
ncbi:MAG: hypothetical protein FWD32_01340, partial [Firmicutes bacterium]|nr:hypothetical protein [Bacillota bacterium]